MYFGLSEEQEFFQDNVKKFLADNASIDEIRKIASGEGQELQSEIYQGIINLGVNALLVPEEYGGLGLSLLHAVAISQALGNGVGPIPFSGSYVMAPLAINLGGSKSQREAFLPKIALPSSAANLDEKMLYRLLCSFIDPWVRVVVFRDTLRATNYLENIVSTPQSIDAGTTFHFMSDNMKKTLFSTLSNSIATTRQ